ncbi:MAG: hypothetical protein ACI8P2_003500 [Candidatus Latescibacterota bacterium]|jgi:hypothetical protein
MFRIRTKPVATLLLVPLVPVLPSYLLAKALVCGFFAIGSNEAVENAVSRSREMANALHRRYAQEAVDLAAALAASDETRHMLHSADLEHTPLVTSAAALGPYSLEIYDEELTLIATLATLDSAQQMRTDTIDEKGFFQRLDTDDPDLRVLDSTLSVDLGSIALHVERKHPQINERAAQFMEERAPLDPWAYRQKLASFTHLTRARRIDTGSDPRALPQPLPLLWAAAVPSSSMCVCSIQPSPNSLYS